MRSFASVLLILIAAISGMTGTAFAAVYKCTTADGTPTYSDQPCQQAMSSPYECAQGKNSIRTFQADACSTEPEEHQQNSAASPQQALPRQKEAPKPYPPISAKSSSTDVYRGITDAAIQSVLSVATYLWWIPALALLYAFVLRPRIKGYLGEQIVRLLLRLRLPKSEYQLFYDVTLRGTDGTTQIDHVVVSRFGIFVIETKTMKGWIFGRSQDAQWTQQIFKFKSRFQNPLRQNVRHISTLQELLGIPAETFHNLVVFIGSAEFRKGRPAGVYSLWNLPSAIRMHRAPIMSALEADAVTARIHQLRLKRGRETNLAHIDDLARRHGR